MALIELSQVTRLYRAGDTEFAALDHVDLKVEHGEFIAVTGSSGSGKSTLMNIIGCLDRPTSGTYLLNGREAAKLSRVELAQLRNATIGFVFQSFNLLPRTSALDNVELPLIYAKVPAAERHRRATAALDRVGLAHRREHQPSQLSGGQQQRVAIARAIVSRPPLILADEPTGNLDTATSYEIMRLLTELCEKEDITVMLVTHEQDIADFAKRQLVLRDGKIIRDERREPKHREHPP
jgi:putative ABC transport system ATP-binding protein